MMGKIWLPNDDGLIVPYRDIQVPRRGRYCSLTQHALEGGSGSAESDPYFSNVVLLMHMDVSTTKDSSSHDWAFTQTGSPSITTDSAWFGEKAMAFAAGATANYVSYSGSSFLSSSTGTFTLECWVRITSITNPNTGGYADGRYEFIRCTSGGTKTFAIMAMTSSNLAFSLGGATLFSAISADRNHIAFIRTDGSPGAFDVYVNGTRLIHNTSAPSFNFDTIYIGNRAVASGVFSVGGLIEEIRITDGIARYTGSSFTPPSSSFPNV
ncbi:LamG domain-containing protein [Methylomagnum ishizawai]|uniref:LamG domain-containing protein n=1 Tax=Methylomagnum ishizawai TaxID=1760988 RepID=UPI001C7F4FA9|nr:LamG domain-containing protein [Methylomagnum ishizawai]